MMTLFDLSSLSVHSMDWLRVLVDISVKGTAVLLVACVLSLALRRASAASRHLVWGVAMAGVLCLPALSMILPGWQISIMPDVLTTATSYQFVKTGNPDIHTGPPRIQPITEYAAPVQETESSVSAAPSEASPIQSEHTTPAVTTSEKTPLHWSVWILLAWAAGAVAALIPFLIGTIGIWRIARRAKPIGHDSASALRDLVFELGLTFPVKVLQKGRSSVPMTWGLFRPVLILPAEAEKWSYSRLRVVLLHELAHVRRRDCLTQTVAQLARAIYWFHPLAWVAARRLRVERERACDDHVINAGANPSDYAGHLLDIARSRCALRCAAVAAVAMARWSQIEGRLLAILDHKRNRRGLTRLSVIFALTALLCFVVPLATIQPIPTAQAAAENPSKTRIVDALGDPIPGGHIEIDGKQYKFENGDLDLPALVKGKHTFVAQADGYESLTREVEFPLSEGLVLTMEYTCSLEFVVRSNDEDSKPIRGAEVIVWRGPEVQRPVSSEVQVQAYHNQPEAGPMVLKPDENGIRVVSDGAVSLRTYRETNGGFMPPKTGDLIVGLSGTMCRIGDRPRHEQMYYRMPIEKPLSKRLRVWDAFTAYALLGSSLKGDDTMEFERGTERFWWSILRMNPTGFDEVAATSKTNREGKCQFDNLPAGTYFAQARKGELRSTISAVHPARKGEELRLKRPNATVVIQAKLHGLTGWEISAVPRANIQLKHVGTRGGGLFTAKADQFGRAEFEQVPWGQYLLTVSPTEESSLDPKTMEVSVLEPRVDFTVEFEVENAHMISGKVVRADTKEPVEGFPLELFRQTRPFGVYGRKTSDSVGRFEFSNALPGEYILIPLTHPGEYMGYLPVKGFLLRKNWKVSEGIEQEFEVVDEDIGELVVPVLPGIETHFSGKVTGPDGVPVSGAEIAFGDSKFGNRYAFLEQENVSKDDGTFSLSIVTTPDDQVREGRLHAAVFAPPEPKKKASGAAIGGAVGGLIGGIGGGVGGVGGGFGQGGPSAQGSQGFQFRVGETVSGIEIVLQTPETAHSLIGAIKTNDGKWPVDLSLYAYQNGQHLQGQVNDDATYRIDWLQPGPFEIGVSIPSMSGTSADGIRFQRKEYCHESRKLVMPEDQRTITSDITLVKAGHIRGKVVDSAGNPIEGLVVSTVGSDSGGYDNTEENGEFWMIGVRPGKTYTVEVKPGAWSTPLARVEGVALGTENLIIPISKIAGIVRDTDTGQPIAGARIQVVRDEET
ncbi:MAG: M56 family metallopeptidase, partial [bacterium]